MDKKPDKDNANANLKNDVLHFEQHSTLSAEEIAKAVQRHNREHKNDARKAARQAPGRGKM